jgi:uncharacterized membrane protein YwzB
MNVNYLHVKSKKLNLRSIINKDLRNIPKHFYFTQNLVPMLLVSILLVVLIVFGFDFLNPSKKVHQKR